MFIFPAEQSGICIIPFWNLSRNINSFRQIRILAIFCTRLQSSFCPGHETFLSEHKLHFMKSLQSFLFSKFIFYICIFILIIFRTVIISLRHRMVSKSYFFFRRRKPSFQHSLNPQYRSRSDWRNLCLRERSERHKLWQRCCRRWSVVSVN